MFRKVVFAVLCVFILMDLQGQTISGTVRNKDKQTLPFVSVFIKNTSWSCSSNEAGYYVLKAPKPGTYDVVYRYIGYKQKIVKLTVTKDMKYDATLEESALELKGVVISAKDEDPAYRIIREAIKKKSYYLEHPKAFKCDVYNKNMVRMKLPEKIMGFKRSDLMSNSKDILDSVGKGVIYFSESMTELYVQKPNDMKEVMISSKVSGDQSGYSFNTASMMLLNLYENSVSGFSSRGLISPLSTSAMMYYKYKLEGTFKENGLLINKIKIIPRRENDPVFRGWIYIVEDEWNLYSTDLLLTKDAQVELFDTLTIKQQYAKVDTANWMPVSNVYDYKISLLGVEVFGYFIGFQSNYVINPELAKNFFNNEVSAIKDSANAKDSTYWNRVRPVALTNEEQKDYHKKDSLEVRYESKSYKDSLDKKGNRFKFWDLIYKNYTSEHSYKQWSFSVSPLLFGLEYNTVEGLSVNEKFTFNKELKNRHDYSLTAKVRYGFANGRLDGSLSYNKTISLLHLSEFSLSGGKYIFQFNPSAPIDKWVNLYYTLFEKLNYAKYYENLFVKANYKRELTNGIYFKGGVSMEYRSPLQNASPFCFNKGTSRVFSSNNPQMPDDYALSFNPNFMASVDLGFVFSIDQEYAMEPGVKTVLGSKYPEFSVLYKKGFGEVDYDFIKLGMNQSVDLKILGYFKYKVDYGVFFNRRKMYFMDYHHSNGNQTIFLKKDKEEAADNESFVISTSGGGQNITGFNLLPYYQYSTNLYYVEAHAEQHFGGWLLNKIPGIRKLRLHEVVGIHYLQNDLINNYFEADVGLEHIGIPKLRIPLYLRIDWVFGFTPKGNMGNGFRIGLGF